MLRKGKSKAEVDAEVTSGRYPPYFRYRVKYTGAKKDRVKSALMMVDIDGANVPLVFSCPVEEEISECTELFICTCHGFLDFIAFH